MELSIFGAFVALPSPSCVTLDRGLNVSELPFFQIVMVISGTRCEKHFTGYQGHVGPQHGFIFNTRFQAHSPVLH